MEGNQTLACVHTHFSSVKIAPVKVPAAYTHNKTFSSSLICVYNLVHPLKVLLHRNTGEEGKFLSVRSNEFDQDLFLLSWGPTNAALSYVFDNADEKSIVQQAINGFR